MHRKMSIGDKFGRLTVIALLPNGRALCRCECGTEKEFFRVCLASGQTKSCGCLAKEKVTRICKQCGKKFIGTRRHIYCEECRIKRTKERDSAYSKKHARKYGYNAGFLLSTDTESKSEHYRGCMLFSDKPLGKNKYRGVCFIRQGYKGCVSYKGKRYYTKRYLTAEEAYKELLTLKQAIAGNTVAEYLKLCKERDERKKKHDKH